VKPIPTKAELRKLLEQEMEAFLEKGGQVEEIPRGVSGREAPTGPLRPDHGDAPPRGDRTYLNDVVAAIEARKRRPGKEKPVRKRPRKRLIYDDFGEPLRWEWVEE
jgi:hypothetical protein